MKKLLAVFMGIVMMFACVGCNLAGESEYDEKTTTVIRIQIQDGGLGREWIDKAGARFAEKYKEKSYADGKTGVVVDVSLVANVTLNNAVTDGTNIYCVYTTVTSSEANKGAILNIDEWMTEKYDMRDGNLLSVEDKISEDSRNMYKGGDGKYYSVPATEYYPGLSYDVNTFNRNGLYLAREGATASTSVEFYSTILEKNFYFINQDDGNDKKSCGPDGKYGTDDDGLPSSLYEFIALCEYMKDVHQVTPFLFAGAYAYYSNFMLSGLMGSLLGADRAKTMYDFDGEMEIVTGFSDDKLFVGGPDEIKKPITQTVNVTEETGYYTTWAVEKYYAEAFMELARNQGWFHRDCDTSTITQKMAMSDFIFNGYGENSSDQIGMISEASFWYNEATLGGYVDMFEMTQNATPGYETRDLRFMALPVAFDETVVENEGKEQTFFDAYRGMYMVNANIKNDAEKLAACKDFIQFMCSDSELSKYTSTVGVSVAMNYDVTNEDKAEMSSYAKHLLTLREEANIIYFEGNNATFKSNPAMFSQFYGQNGIFYYKNYNNVYEAFKDNTSLTAVGVFKECAYSKTMWESVYRGSGTVTSAQGVPALK